METHLLREVNMLDLIEYNCEADEVYEWQWVEANHSYAYRRNGVSGVHDFMLNLHNEFGKIPKSLIDFIEESRAEGFKFVLFHQGT